MVHYPNASLTNRKGLKMFEQPKLADASAPVLKQGGPTLKQWLTAGYSANDYPPAGYAAVADAPVAVAAVGQAVNNTGKTDELSLAVAASLAPKPVTLVQEIKAAGKYALDYFLHGEAIHETHATLPHALARVASLRTLGITPATSTLG
jgi:hypothetical protein